MSAKLHTSLSQGRLDVINRSSGEVSLYYLDAQNELQHFVLPANTEKVALTTIAPISAWRKSQSLALSVQQGRLDVVL